MDYPKSIPNVGLVGGKFVDENISTGLPGSLIPSAWGNAVTDELLAVIRAAGLVPSEDNKTQLLQAIQGIAASDLKQSVRVATTGPIALSGLQAIDGNALAAGYRVLVKDQANASQNGIYVASAGAWVRALDANDNADFTPGFIVVVQAGAQHVGSIWQLKNHMAPTVGTTDLVFGLVFGKTGVAAGDYRKVTVDAQGRVTGGSNPTTLADYGILAPVVPDAPALDWSTTAANTRYVREVSHGFVQIDLAGAGDYVLTDAQAAKAIIYFVGVLTGDRTVILPKAFNRYVIRNATGGPYKLTVKMPVGVGVEVTQGMIASVLTDSSNTLPDQTDYSNVRLTGKSTASTPPADSNDSQIPSTAWVRSLFASYGVGTDNMPDVINTNLGTMFIGGAFFIGAGCTDLPPGVGSGYMHVLPNAGNEAVQTFYSGYREWRRNSSAGIYPTWEETPRTSTVNASISAAVANKADKSNTLAGYGILAATQQEAEQGSDTTKPMTALRVWQAIAAKVVAATEYVAGIARFASLAEVKAGAAGYLAVCPSYLLDGFGYNFGINGYLKFPSWMGGLIIQWAYSDESAGSGDFRYFPVPFTQVVYGTWIQLSVETSTGFAGNFGTILSVPDLTRYQWTAAGTWAGGGKGWILALGK